MFSKFSLKTKIIILSILCCIGVGILAINAFENRKLHPKQENTSKTVIKSDKDNSKQPATGKLEEQAKKIQEEKDKALEEKYEQGYNAFYAKKYDEAIDAETEVINNDANFYKAYDMKGIALCYSSDYHDFQGGVALIDKALQLKPDYGHARFDKALAYELYGHYDEAIQYYKDALAVENYVWSYYGIASIYGRKGDVENTVKYLGTAVNMDPSIKNVAKDEVDFANVKNNKEFQDLLK
ncbi:MAG: hypothetical protein Q8936_04190 [Bacillota bacterium]|nr:hypothetical protein [Bacillota bacterium]